jgi:DNA-binding MarR family transcriptional regulator/N-acetylglutamate synthase-like GNAT family acetyltransferase
LTPSTKSPDRPAAAAVAAVRAFNRFYTRRIGVLGDHLLGSRYSLSEMRVLYELAHRPAPTATELGRDLGLDPGYLSRILRRFEERRLIARTTSPADGRQSHVRLTARGRAAFAPLDRQARHEVAGLLAPLDAAAQREVVTAMERISRILDDRPAAGEPFTLRAHRPGDMGWVVERHGALYAAEWGYDEHFEALVARITADFLDRFQPDRERCWIAERDGIRIGSVFLVEKTKTVAKLRMLLVEPSARGLGLGRRLVEVCVAFARAAGYRRITLWTHSELAAARRIYEQAGFTCTAQEATRDFSRDLVSETWEKDLRR